MHYTFKAGADTRPGTGESPQLAALDLVSWTRGQEKRCDTLPVKSTERRIVCLSMLTALFTQIGGLSNQRWACRSDPMSDVFSRNW